MQPVGAPMADLAVLEELVLAHRILVNEGVLDAFGHVSVRHADDPSRFWLSSALPPSVVEVGDLALYGLDGEPIEPVDAPLFSERFIHSEIYRARPDVQSVCHHHAPAVLPFCIGLGPLVPVSQTGAFLGPQAPLWDSADEFGDTAMLITDPLQAASLARSLGTSSLVLMRGHGVTVVGADIRTVVFKSVYACREADMLRAAGSEPKVLSAGEVAAVGQPRRPAVDRCWMHWSASLPADRTISGKS